MFKNFKSIRMVITRAMVFRGSVYVSVWENRCRYKRGTYPSFSQQTIGRSQVAIFVRRSIRGLFVFLLMFNRRFAVRHFCRIMGNVYLSLLLLCTIRSVFRITHISKSVCCVRSLLRKEYVVRFTLKTRVRGNLSARVLRFPRNGTVRTICLYQAMRLTPACVLSNNKFMASRIARILGTKRVRITKDRFRAMFVIRRRRMVEPLKEVINRGHRSHVKSVNRNGQVVFKCRLQVIKYVCFRLPLSREDHFPFGGAISCVVLFTGRQGIEERIYTQERGGWGD